MQLKIDTTGVQFRVAGLPRPKKFTDSEPQATTQDGRPDLDGPPRCGRSRPADQGDHLGRGGW